MSINKYEGGKGQLNDETALHISKHLNKIVSILIEHDVKIDTREFDLWRGMAAGSQAQGSWQNTKGDRAEIVIKEIIERRIREKGLVLERFGAALKSLRRAKQENSKSITVLVMQGISLTTKAEEEIQNGESIIDYFFTIEDIIGNEKVRKDLFKILKI